MKSSLIFSLILVSLPLGGCASPAKADSITSFKLCQQDATRLKDRSAELQKIVDADQADRQDWQKKTGDEMIEVVKRDEVRRKRVGEIFGEGCFTKAQDYAAAALVYQHGATPDHFYQTFIWSMRAVELGDEKQKRMMALGIDRYLVNIGQKQLFASQAIRPGANPGACWCLQKVEDSFSDKTRKEIGGKSYKEALAWVRELNGETSCPETECAENLKSSPKGTVPGFW